MTSTFGATFGKKGKKANFNDSFDRDSIDFGFGNNDLNTDFGRPQTSGFQGG